MHESKTDDQREQVALAALAEQFGRPLSDDEWSTAQARLLSYARLLRDWELRKKSGEKAPPA